jgi:sigma-54 specific flagellar transcriptional regulator A
VTPPDATGAAEPDLLAQAAELARTDMAILLQGESGTGKAALARFIHQHSGRAAGPFVTLHCATLRDFDHCAHARGGTLFVDAVGELSASMQVELLRVRDVRLVAATKRDLFEEADAGRFRRDLFEVLSACTLRLAPLRERPRDIERLFKVQWRRRGETRPLLPEVFLELARCSWPGNVRELDNLVERIAVCSSSETITPADLPPEYRARNAPQRPLPAVTLFAAVPAFPAPVAGELLPVNLNAILRDIESAYIDAALVQTDGNRQAAASLLGLQRTTLVEKIRRRVAGGDESFGPTAGAGSPP